LLAINSVSLCFALAANLALLLNMARRASFAIGQSITIAGFYMSGFMLIALVAVANSHHFKLGQPERHALTQAFFYAIFAAMLYCVIATLMVITVIGAYRGHYEKQFSLTSAQRTLMLQTVMFMAYLLFGALVYKYIENWKYPDAMFFANFTLLTIGLGTPFTPQTHLGRSLLFPYAFGGIVSVGLVIGSIRSLVLDRGKKKLKARFVERKRENTLKSIDEENRTIRISWIHKYSFSQKGLSEAQRREQEFQVMRKIQDLAVARGKYMSLIISATAGLLLWLGGAAIFTVCEREQSWTYFTALYFSYTSLLTIGYGDLQPTSNGGKPFFVLWTLLAVPTLTIFISHMGDTVIKTFANLTIWAGSVTILPQETGLRHGLRLCLHHITLGALVNPRELRSDRPPGLIPYSSDTEHVQESVDDEEAIVNHALDRLQSHIQDDELADAADAQAHGDRELRDAHLYHYVLVRELKGVVRDLQNDPDHKRYSYRDWMWFLKLLGQDESDPSLHRAPHELHRRRSMLLRERAAAQQRGQAQPTMEEIVGSASCDARVGDVVPWSWLGARSPLMSAKSEPLWLAERLGARLEREMKMLRRGKRDEPLPVSLGDLLKRAGEKRQSSPDMEEDLERVKENGL
jgi:potassium channel subfamily K